MMITAPNQAEVKPQSLAALLKASYRRDRWPPDLAAFLPNGYAAAMQVSYQLDLQP